MEWLGTLLAVLLWAVGMPIVVFGVLRVIGYDWDKPWLMWRTRAGPLPLWVYLAVSLCLGVVLIVTAATR